MVIMRAKGTGSFDPKTKTWRLRSKGIHITVRQLANHYGVTWQSSSPAQLERETVSFWRKYLQDIEDTEYEQRKAVHPLRRRIQSIEAAISRLKADNRFTAELAALREELTEAVAVDESTEHLYHDTPIVPPDLPEHITTGVKLGIFDTTDEFTTSWLNELVEQQQPQQKNKTSIVKEAQSYIERFKIKSKSTRSWRNIDRALQHLLDITGDIDVEDVTAQHYRQLYCYLNDEGYSANTKNAKLQTIRTFLERLVADYNIVTYGFLRNKDYTFTKTDGDKEKYTLEQVQIALENATGEIRTALLLGLNCGFYFGDIETMTPDMIVDNHIIRSRDKLKHQKAIQGSWLMWDETQNNLKFNIKCLKKKYRVFAEKYNLPSHKALRKTTAQVIHDVVGDAEASRLFRCEKLHGTHGSHYITDFSPAQVKRLDKALKRVEKYYGIS